MILIAKDLFEDCIELINKLACQIAGLIMFFYQSFQPIALVDLNVLLNQTIKPSNSFLSSQVYTLVNAKGLQPDHLLFEQSNNVKHVL